MRDQGLSDRERFLQRADGTPQRLPAFEYGESGGFRHGFSRLSDRGANRQELRAID